MGWYAVPGIGCGPGGCASGRAGCRAVLLADHDLATSYFLTAPLAARRLVANASGVIMTVTNLHSRAGYPLAGVYGLAMAAKEALTRELSTELAPQGIRVVGLRPNAIPEAKRTGEAFAPRAKALE